MLLIVVMRRLILLVLKPDLLMCCVEVVGMMLQGVVGYLFDLTANRVISTPIGASAWFFFLEFTGGQMSSCTTSRRSFRFVFERRLRLVFYCSGSAQLGALSVDDGIRVVKEFGV